MIWNQIELYLIPLMIWNQIRLYLILGLQFDKCYAIARNCKLACLLLFDKEQKKSNTQYETRYHKTIPQVEDYKTKTQMVSI